jgi:dienelactone hydrolase
VIESTTTVDARVSPPGMEAPLPGGGALRVDAGRGPLVVLFGGSSYRDGPGRWSGAMQWLAGELSERGWRTAQVRYPSRSWRDLDSAAAAGREALDLLPPVHALVGFSMGAAVAVANAERADPRVIIGLAPWLPEQLPMAGLESRRVSVLHGSLDRPLPGIPGVRPSHSRAALARAARAGARTRFALVPGGIHLIAVRLPWGRLVPAPRGRRWREAIVAELRDAQST